MALFKKNIVVGVSVSFESGLEVAQIDFSAGKILKYGSRQLIYDNNRREIADLDIFKETLEELLFDLQIPKGSEIVLNLPSVVFKVKDYPASLNAEQIFGIIEEDMLETPIFKESDPCISAVKLPISTIQSSKIAYSVLQKPSLIEIAMQIKDLGYKLKVIDTSVNSTLNTLIYRELVDVNPETTWVMMLVESNCCRVIPMQGRNYIDCFEERISIGEVLGDDENYSTVINAVAPYLKNLPSKYLCVVSKTNIISAEALAGKLYYSSPIIHQEANCFIKEPLLEMADAVDPSIAKRVSFDVIGAAINTEFEPYSTAKFNLFNETLGDVYILEQPLTVKMGNNTIVFSMENMILASILFALLILGIGFAGSWFINKEIESKQEDLDFINSKIAQSEKYIRDNQHLVSSELFDESFEISKGLAHNKNLFLYYQIVGTRIPKKLWLTAMELGQNTTIEGQADNVESVYSFYRNIKNTVLDTKVQLQKLSLATNSNMTELSLDGTFDTESIITSMNADFYEFSISDKPKEDTEETDRSDIKPSKQVKKKIPGDLQDF